MLRLVSALCRCCRSAVKGCMFRNTACLTSVRWVTILLSSLQQQLQLLLLLPPPQLLQPPLSKVNKDESNCDRQATDQSKAALADTMCRVTQGMYDRALVRLLLIKTNQITSKTAFKPYGSSPVTMTTNNFLKTPLNFVCI